MKKIIICLMLIALTACTTTDPYTGDEQTSDSTKGAGIGALTGALLGAAVSGGDDRGKGALIGALVGGGIGGGIGHSMDKQESELRAQLQGTGVQVQRQGDNIRLIMPGNITFPTDSYSIRPDFYNVLNSVVLVIKHYDNTAIRIGGHTDSTGNPESNQTLSEERANSVGRYFISQGVKAGRVQTQGYGDRYPIASNDTAAGRAQNRRVEIQLLPM